MAACQCSEGRGGFGVGAHAAGGSAVVASCSPVETSAPTMCLKVINSLGRNDEM